MRGGERHIAPTNDRPAKRSAIAWLALAWAILAFLAAPASADSTKTISGKLHSVKGNVLTVEKKGLGHSTWVEIEMDEHTKVNGEVAQGWDAKIQYREESVPGSAHEVRRVALEIQTHPHMASKAAKEAAKQTPPPKKDQP